MCSTCFTCLSTQHFTDICSLNTETSKAGNIKHSKYIYSDTYILQHSWKINFQNAFLFFKKQYKDKVKITNSYIILKIQTQIQEVINLMSQCFFSFTKNAPFLWRTLSSNDNCQVPIVISLLGLRLAFLQTAVLNRTFFFSFFILIMAAKNRAKSFSST